MTKDQARRQARERLRALSPEERRGGGEAIARRLWSLPELSGARTLLLYAALPDEVPTDDIAREALRRGIALTYPRCLPEARALAIHRLQGVEELRNQGSYGIREPDPTCPLLAASDVDVALVPGLAWSRAGVRLGRGAGYYDRLFADPSWRGFRCGLFFGVQELPGLPADAWDAPLDAVVTEREVWRRS